MLITNFSVPWSNWFSAAVLLLNDNISFCFEGLFCCVFQSPCVCSIDDKCNTTMLISDSFSSRLYLTSPRYSREVLFWVVCACYDVCNRATLRKTFTAIVMKLSQWRVMALSSCQLHSPGSRARFTMHDIFICFVFNINFTFLLRFDCNFECNKWLSEIKT